MPRKPSDNDFQIALKVPRAWIDSADAIAAAGGFLGGISGVSGITRTDILRAAIRRGLDDLEQVIVQPREWRVPKERKTSSAGRLKKRKRNGRAQARRS